MNIYLKKYLKYKKKYYKMKYGGMDTKSSADVKMNNNIINIINDIIKKYNDFIKLQKAINNYETNNNNDKDIPKLIEQLEKVGFDILFNKQIQKSFYYKTFSDLKNNYMKDFPSWSYLKDEFKNTINIAKKSYNQPFVNDYMRYLLPLINGQYYMSDTGADRDFFYKLYNIANYNTNINKIDLYSKMIEKVLINNLINHQINKNTNIIKLNSIYKKYSDNDCNELLNDVLPDLKDNIDYKEYIFNIKLDNNTRKDYLFLFDDNTNYYFFGGFKYHSVFIAKIKNIIVIGNVGAAMPKSKLIKNDLESAITYYEFNKELMFMLYFYKRVMSENMYKHIINRLREIKQPPKNFEFKESKESKENKINKILDYDIVLDKYHFYLKPQDLGTCTWHATFMANIFFNYYYNSKPIDLVKYYEQAKNKLLEFINEYKYFEKFSISTLNIKLINYINEDKEVLKNNIISYINKSKLDIKLIKRDNKNNELPIDIKYLFIEYKSQYSYDTKNIIQIIEKYYKIDNKKNNLQNLTFNFRTMRRLLNKIKLGTNLYYTNKLKIIYIYELYKKIINKNQEFNKKYNSFYNQQNLINFHNSLKNKKLPIDIDENNINIVYEVYKLSYYLIQNNYVEDHKSKKTHMTYNLKNTFDYIDDTLYYEYDTYKDYLIDLKYNIEISNGEIDVNDLYDDLSILNTYSDGNIDYNPIILYNDDDIVNFFISLIYYLNFNISPPRVTENRLYYDNIFNSKLNLQVPYDTFVLNRDYVIFNPYIIYTSSDSIRNTKSQDKYQLIHYGIRHNTLYPIPKLKISNQFNSDDDIIEKFYFYNVTYSRFQMTDKYYYDTIFYLLKNKKENYIEEYEKIINMYDSEIQKNKELHPISNKSYFDLFYTNYFINTDNINSNGSFNIELLGENINTLPGLSYYDTNYNLNPKIGLLKNKLSRFNLKNLEEINNKKYKTKIHNLFKEYNLDLIKYLQHNKIKNITLEPNNNIKYKDNEVMIKVLPYNNLKISNYIKQDIFLVNDTEIKGTRVSNIEIKNENCNYNNIINKIKNIEEIIFVKKDNEKENIYYAICNVIFTIKTNEIYLNEYKIYSQEEINISFIEKQLEYYNNIFISDTIILIVLSMNNDNINKDNYKLFNIEKLSDKKMFIEIKFDKLFSRIINIHELNYMKIKYSFHLFNYNNDSYFTKIFYDVIKNYIEYKDDKKYIMESELDHKIGSIFGNSLWKIQNEIEMKPKKKINKDKEIFTPNINPKIKSIDNIDNIDSKSIIFKLYKENYNYEILQKFINIINNKIDKNENKIKNLGDCKTFISKLDKWNDVTELTKLEKKISHHHYFEMLYSKHYINIIIDNIEDYVNYIQYRQIKKFFDNCNNALNCSDESKIINCINDILKYFIDINVTNKNITDILFEYHFGSIIYQRQKGFIDQYYTDIKKENKNNIYQLLPGWGKTMVLTPYLILDMLIKPKIFPESKNGFENNKDKVFLVLPNHLVLQSYEAIVNILNYYGLNTKIIDFHEKQETRQMKQELKLGGSVGQDGPRPDLEKKELKKKITDSKKNEKLNIKFLNYKFYKNDNNKSKYISFKNMKDLINSNIDVYIFSTYALQYNLLQTKDLKTINDLDFKKVFWIFDEIDFKQYNDSEYNISGKKKINPILKKIVKKYFYNRLSLNISNEEEKKVESEDEKTIKEEKYEKLLNNYYDSANRLNLYEKYGIGIRNNIPNIVPYSTVNTPLINSSFSNLFYNINLNLIYYMNNDIHNNDIILMMKKEIKKIKDINKILLNYTSNIFDINSHDLINNPINDNLIIIKYKMSEENENYSDYKKKIMKYFIEEILLDRICSYSENVTFSCFYNLISPYIYINKDCIAKDCIGFSGTINFELPYKYSSDGKKLYLNTGDTLEEKYKVKYNPYHFNIPIEDTYSKSIILENLESKNQVKMKLLTFEEKDNIQTIIRHILSHNIYVIIDVAAKFKDYSAKQIATIMVDEYNKIEQKPKIIKYFVFINNNKKKKMMDLKKNITDYHKKYMNEIGVIYTQADIVGVDISIGPIDGVALFKEDTSYTKIVQGIGRLRKLSTIHNIHFMCNNSIINNKELPLILNSKLNNQNLIKFFKNNDKKELVANKKTMYKHALFDFLQLNEIRLNIFEEDNFYDYIKNDKKLEYLRKRKEFKENKNLIDFLIEQINNSNNINSTHQEQKQDQKQDQKIDQKQDQEKSRIINKIDKVIEIDIKNTYNIFECFINDNFSTFYNNNDMDELKQLNIFISPFVYKVSLYKTKYKTSAMYYTLYNEENKKYVVLSLKEYVDLKTVQYLLKNNLIVEYYANILKGQHSLFLVNFNKYKEINRDRNIVLSFILNFIMNHDYFSLYFLNNKKFNKLINYYYYNSHVGLSELYNLETNAWNKKMIEQIINSSKNIKIYQNIKNKIKQIMKKQLAKGKIIYNQYATKYEKIRSIFTESKKFNPNQLNNLVKEVEATFHIKNTKAIHEADEFKNIEKTKGDKKYPLNTTGGALKLQVVNYTQNNNLNLYEKLESLKQVKGSLIQMMRKLNMRIPVGHILGGRINDDIEKLKEENSNIIYKFIKKYKKLPSSMKYQIRNIMKTFNNIIIKDN